MREILFRGKSTDTGAWVYGYYCGPFGYFDEHEICDIADPTCSRIDVDPETVGQYTGLNDVHGKQIFEGDIVECWSEGVKARGTVQQRQDGLWIIYPAWQKSIMWGLCPDEYGHTSAEVIGNIHDNPELIGGKEDGT